MGAAAFSWRLGTVAAAPRCTFTREQRVDVQVERRREFQGEERVRTEDDDTLAKETADVGVAVGLCH